VTDIVNREVEILIYLFPGALLALTICAGVVIVVRKIRRAKIAGHEEQLSGPEIIDTVKGIAVDLLKDGNGASEIESKLLDEGIDESTAADLTRRSIKLLSQEETTEGIRNMRWGGAFFGAGVVVTAVTYWAASPGKTYVIAWGAIVFGAFEFINGLAHWRRGSYWSTK